MKNTKMFPGLLFVLVVSLFLFGQSPAQETKTECDVKTVKSFYHCEACGKLLRGFKCSVCSKEQCKFCKDEMMKINSMAARPGYRDTPENKLARQKEQTILTDHQSKCYEITELKDFKCPCCEAPLKSLEEVDLTLNNKCRFCQSNNIKQKEYCIKWIYGCPDGHKGVLLPELYNNKCPELVDDGKGKKKECKKPLEKVEISIEEVIFKYVCPECKAVYDKAGKCEKCDKNLTKIKTCAKSEIFPHINGKEFEKEEKARRDDAKKEGEQKNEPNK